MKTFIQNRKGQKIYVVVDEQKDAKGLVFLMHGLGGFKDQPQMQMFAKAFHNSGYTTVLFDTTNTFGESDGKYEDATTTNYYEDLEDVISWAGQQSWHQEPFVLAGHSLGGICTALYAENYPEKVKALAPISTVVSGALSEQNKISKGELENWKQTGWREEISESIPGLVKRLKWSHMGDRMKYDLMPKVGNLTMPVLMIVGELDKSTPPAHQQILFDAILGNKKMHVIKGAPHTFREQKHLDEVKTIFDKWIKTL